MDDLDHFLTENVRELYDFYKSTTQLIIYLPRENGGIGIKKISDVYYVTRLSFLIKMLNHPVPEIRNVARSSLDLDMRKRGVPTTIDSDNFLGYKLTERQFLKCSTKYGCQSDWPELVRYARKLNVAVIYSDEGTACIKINGVVYHSNIRDVLNKSLLAKYLESAKKLSIQGSFFTLKNLQIKSSHSVLYNWNISDSLVKFCLKARLNILPTEYTKFLWNKENNPICTLCRFKPEYMSHVLNGCNVLNNFYSRRHDRIVDKFADELKLYIPNKSISVNKLCEKVFPFLKEELVKIVHRKPDIVVVRNDICYIVELTVCYDTYFEFSHAAKVSRYGELVNCLNNQGIKSNLLVMCFGSLGTIKGNVRNNLRILGFDSDNSKYFLSWASISCIIGANYIWRHRVKKIFNN